MSEIMATRHTFDGIRVQFWTDGSVTHSLFALVQGAGAAKLPEEIEANRAACWLLAEEVCLYDVAELPKAVRMARRAVRQSRVLPLVSFRTGMADKPAVPPAFKSHAGNCRCIRCVREHVENGCRRIRCPVCG